MPDKNTKLNPEQVAAITHGTGPLLIIAGAGTGKTTVITERIKHLILEKDVKPKEILALTFTEKAAREMEERVDRVMPYGYTQMWITTFHSFCDRILRQEAFHIGLDTKYKLMTEAESIQLVRQNIFKFNLNYFRPLGNPNKFIGVMMQHFSRLQDENITPAEYLTWVNLKLPEEKLEQEKYQELASAYQKYDELKIKEGLMDFGDLIVKTIELFEKRPNVKKQYQESFKYVLIDEFQDTNYAQSVLSNLLVGQDKNINVVGDDDQAVYRFRGAAISNILQFRKNYPTSKVVVLNKNYRSGQQILDKAYTLIQFNNPDRLEVAEGVDKKLVAQNKIKGEVKVLHQKRVEDEADAVAKKIEELSVNFDYKDFAILVRANNHADPFIKALSRRLIPYQFLGPGKLFKEPEIIDLICYLKVLYNTDDSLSLYRVLSIDELEINARDISKILNYAKRIHCSLFEACEQIDEILLIGNDTKEKIDKICTILHKHLKLLKENSAGQILYSFLEASDLLEPLLNPSPAHAVKAANIARLFDKLKTYEVDHEDASVTAVVDWIDLQQEMGESPLSSNEDWSEENAVNILTIHGSKGLEFPVVFIVNFVSLRFPSTERREPLPIPTELIKEVLPSGDFHIEEERRLCYVGMTRAKEKLFLTAADYYGDGKREKKLSQFLFEIFGDTNFEDTDVKSQQLSLLDYSIKSNGEAITPVPAKRNREVTYISYSQIETFKICPMHYHLRYNIKVPTPPSSSQSFGISVHNTLKDFYLELINGKKKNETEILYLLKKNWILDGYVDRTHQEESFKKAIRILNNYIEKEVDITNLPVLLEQPFIAPLSYQGKSIKIGGKIDRVDVLPGGRIEIIDYKTGANIPTEKDVKEDMQLSFYALAATLIKEPPFNKKPEEIILSLYYFEEEKKFSTKRSVADLEKAKEEIFKYVAEIEKSDFSCSGNFLCQHCEYNIFCNKESVS